MSPLAVTIAAIVESRADSIVHGFGVVPGAFDAARMTATEVLARDTIPPGLRVVATSAPFRVVKGAARAEAVIRHLRMKWAVIQSRYPADGSCDQAGAAACDAMADVLQAAVSGNLDGLKAVLERFVNGAVEAGVVTA